MVKIQIRSRWSGNIVFECDVEAGENTSEGFRLGLAVKIAIGQKADLRDADLSDADLRDAVLIDADLSGADLSDADLIGADWIPRIENIHQKVYAAASAPEALNMGSWHQDGYCGTTHCRAGWVCVLAGPGGKVLEGVYGAAAAAALIYQASDPKLERVPSWYATNSEARDDMKRLAEAEAVAV